MGSDFSTGPATAPSEPTAGAGQPTMLAAALTATRWRRVIIVLLGICALQFLLYGPSLLGQKILLPLELLAEGGVYLPADTPAAKQGAHDASRFDVVLQFEPERQFAARELAAGRWPRWLPYEYGGVPMRFSVLSPLFLFKAGTPSPVVLAWAQLLVAIIAGLGMYAFCRRVLTVGFWPAAVAAWAYPITGFFVLWQGFPVADTICWFPWLLTAAQATFQRPSAGRVTGVAASAAMMVYSGQLDVAGLGLIACVGVVFLAGIHLAWNHRSVGAAFRPLGGVAAGIVLGLLLAAPYVLPFLEYARGGERIEQRAEGRREERPPVGVAAVPLVVWPDMDGRLGAGKLFFRDGNQMESASTGYVGVVAALFLAPLAWCSRRHRAASILCAIAIVLGLGWCANLPGWVTMLRWPGLNLFSFDRFVFISGFALVALAAIGLDVLTSQPIRRHGWFAVPILLLLGLLIECARRRSVLPEPLATQIAAAIGEGKSLSWVRTLDDLRQVQSWYRTSAADTAILGAVALAGWLWLLLNLKARRALVPLVALVVIGELLHFASGRSSQTDASLYYPSNRTLAAACPPGTGRVIGFFCLPANVAATQGLVDVRGYDPVEPARMVELLRLSARPDSPTPSYTSTQWLAPMVVVMPPADNRVAPVLDLLGARYVLSRGRPPPQVHADFAGNDYWGVINRYAMPRVFVPQHVAVEPEAQRRLQRLGNGQYNPRAIAYLETPVALPDYCAGTATILNETPTRLTVSAQMSTPGLLVLTDRWDVGWRAMVDGKPAPILRANHALRGVVLPAGACKVVFEYAPTSFRLGSILALAAVLVVFGSFGVPRFGRQVKPAA